LSATHSPAAPPAVPSPGPDGAAAPEPGPEPEPEPGGLPLRLGETAALLGEYRWIENALYGVVGSWVADIPAPSVQLYLDAQSMRHAWHAELWAERLPVLTGADPDGLSVPSARTSSLFSSLSGLSGASATSGPGWSWPPDDEQRPIGALPRLAGLYRVVLPRLVVSYQRHLRATRIVTDAPVVRALRLVLNDEIEDWQAGERIVQRLVNRPHDVVAVYQFQQGLEAALVAAGAGSGLVDLPRSVPDE
jgi:hypothetical protein